jgi:hypothetical protein
MGDGNTKATPRHHLGKSVLDILLPQLCADTLHVINWGPDRERAHGYGGWEQRAQGQQQHLG